MLLKALFQNFTYSFGYLVKNDYNIANKLVKLNSDVHACFILQSCSQITCVYERKRVYERTDGISLFTTVNTGLKMYQNNWLLHAPIRIERDMKHLGSLTRTQEVRVAPGMPRAALHRALQNPCCFISPTNMYAWWHQVINSAFQTSCKVNCPKLVTKFNLVFTRCNILLLTFEQTFTDGAVWLGGAAEAVRKIIFYPRLICLLP